MKNYSSIWLLLIILIFFSTAKAQLPGSWTWKGGKTTITYSGYYGIKGVASPSNNPPGLYEACEWQDSKGTFWLYGGANVYGFHSALWKYDLQSNLWTWVSGSNLVAQMPKYGIKGVPSTTNSPGLRTACYTWVDKDDKLWLYGGYSSMDSSGAGLPYNDLWKYDPINNTWTWMKGDAFYTGNLSVYGTKGVESSTSKPRFSEEIGISWTDDAEGNLWMVDNIGCLWRYRISNNSWTWMKGDTLWPAPNKYGTKGIPALSNTPGASYLEYTRWKTKDGSFWYFQNKALWRYQHTNNCWTWMWGDTLTATNPEYGSSRCEESDNGINPWRRIEARTCWVDDCDNLWVLGGGATTFSTNVILNDMIFYSTRAGKWFWAAGDSVQQAVSVFGTLNVPSSANHPSSRTGAHPFKDNKGNFWFYGGANFSFAGEHSDMWMFTPNPTCTGCNTANLEVNGEVSQNTAQVYPNPTSAIFNVRYLQKNALIEIYDGLGYKVSRRYAINSEEQFTLPQKGVYFVTINHGGLVQCFKVICTTN